jgi:hypothetical protein
MLQQSSSQLALITYNKTQSHATTYNQNNHIQPHPENEKKHLTARQILFSRKNEEVAYLQGVQNASRSQRRVQLSPHLFLREFLRRLLHLHLHTTLKLTNSDVE